MEDGRRRLPRSRARNASSRAWAFYVNVLGASPLLTGDARLRLYRRAGLDFTAVRIGPACYFHSDNLAIGAGTFINHGCHFENVGRVEIGRDCAFGMRVLVTTSTHSIGPSRDRSGQWRVEPVTVGDGCWIGAGAILLPGVTVHPGCIVAAGAVVTESCEADGLYAGTPARRLRDLPDEGG
jgi:maltose O-acetyltransferase